MIIIGSLTWFEIKTLIIVLTTILIRKKYLKKL